MWTKRFWKDAIERAIKTTAQVLVVLVPTTTAILEGGLDWRITLIGAGGAAAASFVTSLLSSLVGSPSSASVLPALGPGEKPEV